MCESTTLNDWLVNKKLWDAVNAVKQFPFLEGNLSSVMESSLKVLFGQRVMFRAMFNLTVEEVANQLVMLYGEKWIALTTAHTDLNLAGDYIIRRNGDVKKDTAKNVNGKNKHQTIAYNETDLSDASAEVINSDETGNETQTSSGDEEKISYTSYFKNLQSADRLAIMETILRDAARLLTINVY